MKVFHLTDLQTRLRLVGLIKTLIVLAVNHLTLWLVSSTDYLDQ